MLPGAVAARDAEPYAFRMMKARVRKAIGGVDPQGGIAGSPAARG